MQSRAATFAAFAPRTCLWLLAGWAVAGCSGAHEPAQTPPPPTRASVAPTTDVPALLNKSIDELRARLGPVQALPPAYRDPLTAVVGAARPGGIDSLLAFRTGGLTLVASYDARTRRVRDLVLLGRHEDSLMARASLRPSAPAYLLLPVYFVGRPSRFMGLRVVSARQN